MRNLRRLCITLINRLKRKEHKAKGTNLGYFDHLQLLLKAQNGAVVETVSTFCDGTEFLARGVIGSHEEDGHEAT